MAANRWLLAALPAILAGCALNVTGRANPTSRVELVGSGFAVMPRSAEPPVPDAAPEPPPADPLPPPPVAVAPPPVLIPTPPPDPPLLAVVRAAVENRPELGLDALKAFDPATQELLLQFVPALVSVAAAKPSASPHELGMLVGQLDALSAALSPRASLVIEKALFCTEAQGFGQYSPRPAGVPFRPGAIALLYFELKNPPCVPTRDGFVVPLKCTVRLRSAAGESEPVVFNGRPMPELDVVKHQAFLSPIRDCPVRMTVPLPTRAGQYVLALEVLDDTPGRAGGRRVTRQLTFAVE